MLKRFFNVVVAGFSLLAQGQIPAKLSSSDRQYLMDIARDTWRCVAGLQDDGSGLPYDNSDRGEYTSVSNIGLLLSSIAAAKALGFIDAQEADDRVGRCLTSVEKLNTTFGFQQSWNSVKTLAPAKHDPWISLLDSGNLAAGLLTVAHTIPSAKSRALKLFDALQWGQFYDAKQRALLGGYSLEKKDFNRQWRLDLLASDALLCQFFAVARGAAPGSYLSTLRQDKETREGYTYLAPGWQGGGLFMQYIWGIWLDTRGTPLADSSENFARAQMAHAKSIGAPVWGWSACDNPSGGYLGWGRLIDEVVTPHACALPIERFPAEAVANFRALEALGARSPDRGFYDSVNWKTRAHSRLFLSLDQGMLLLSLTNYLTGGGIRKAFQSDPVVRKGQDVLLANLGSR